jgi:hypothetical protein
MGWEVGKIKTKENNCAKRESKEKHKKEKIYVYK